MNPLYNNCGHPSSYGIVAIKFRHLRLGIVLILNFEFYLLFSPFSGIALTDRYPKAESATLSLFADQPDFSSMRFYDLFGYCQAQA